MNARPIAVICIGLLIPGTCSPQISPTPPKNWKRVSPIYPGLGSPPLKLAHNEPELIRQEILDTNTVLLIALSCGLKDSELASIQVAQAPGAVSVQVYQLEGEERPFKLLSDQLRNYVLAREEGHTRSFVLAALTNRPAPSTISDPDLRAIATYQPLLPVLWLKRAESGTTTNKAGQVASRVLSYTIINGVSATNETAHIPKVDEVRRWVTYWLADGEVAWRYTAQFGADGSVDYVHDDRCDAKEYDPNYQKVIKEVEEEAHAEMRRNGTVGLGSVHTFWHIKKEKLKAKGIAWRSPDELNPNARYD